jgi:amino acid adenylation domain-containing protein/non-ribosomal peptide synthase protein (TIGR01720 family)
VDDKRALLKKLLARDTAASGRPSGEISKRDRGDVAPLSYAQEGIWYQELLAPGSPDFNIGGAVTLHGALDVRALERAFGELVRRHEVLRTVYPAPDGRPFQQILAPTPFELDHVDLSALDGSAREIARARHVAEVPARGFDLVHGPVFRTKLVTVRPTEHVLLLCVHNIVIDRGLDHLLAELATLYGAFAAGRPSPLPEPTLQYGDHAAHQRATCEEVIAAQLPFWRDRLATLPPLLELATDPPAREALTFRRAFALQLPIPAAAVLPLRAIAREMSATFFAATLSAFYVLLSRYTGRTRMAIGTTVDQRHRPELEKMIGCFQNTLVLTTDLSDDPTFRQLLARVRTELLQAFGHQHVPFQKLVEAVQPTRSAERMPIVQLMFNMERRSPTVASFGQVPAEIAPIDAGRTRFELAFRLFEDGGDGDVGGYIAYRTDLFEPAAIERLWKHYRTLVEGAGRTPDLPVSRLPMVSETERRTLLELASSAGPSREEALAHRRFESHARTRPEATAVEVGGVAMTYRELDRRANALAHELRALGVGPDVLVGVWAEPSFERVVGVLGVLKAGGAYVPLDPAYPRERLAHVIADARLQLVVAPSASAARLSAPGLRIVEVDGATVRDDPPTVTVAREHLAYVIYTSGSTGAPKGVLVTHRGLSHLASAAATVFGLGPGMRVLHAASFGFDASVLELFMALGSGGTVCIPPADMRGPGEPIARYLESERIDVVAATASFLRTLPPVPLPHASIVISGGEPLTVELVERWAHDRHLFNSYGPTEATVWSSTARVELGQRRPPIGRAVPHASQYVLDGQLEPVPFGVRGELYIGGNGVARGYLGQPGLTAERFVPDAFSPVPGARLYRTGDVVWMRSDGALEFLGRCDEQIKVRGTRIEPGEVEARLRAQPGIAQCAVIVRPSAAGNQLCAFYVSGPGHRVDTHALRDRLAEHLLDAMIPQRWIELRELPLTPGGKLDRLALARTELEPTTTAYVEPRTPTERLLASLFASLLAIERVGARDNFFELGGDSILSIQLVDRASRAGLPLTAALVLRHQTVEELARAATAAAPQPDAPESDLSEGALVPLLPVQLWFLDELTTGHATFTQSFLVEARTRLDLELLTRTLALLQDHHEALRLRFHRTRAGWEQRVARAPGGAQIPAVELRELSDDDALADWIERAQHAPFDLAGGALLRAVVLRGARDRLLLVAHHLVVDAVSWRILLEDLEQLYRQLERGEPEVLRARTASFSRWARWLETYAAAPEALQEAPRWRAQAGLEVPPLPRDPPGPGSRTEVVRSELSVEHTRALFQGLPQALGVRANDVLLTALARAFRRWTGHRTTRFDVEGHGRDETLAAIDLSRTVGWFTCAYPVAIELTEHGEPLADVRAVQEQLAHVPRGGLGYGVLRYLCPDPDVRRSLREGPRAEVVFNYLGRIDVLLSDSSMFRSAPELSGATDSRRDMGHHVLEINAVVSHGCLRALATYRPEMHRRETIVRLVDAWMSELETMAIECRP